MKELVFATHNKDKAREIQQMLDNSLRILSLWDIGCTEEIPENGKTLQENAVIKAVNVYIRYRYDCFADDTGFEISALNNEPGVISARYAGPERDNNKNIKLVLSRMMGAHERSARFRTVICLILDGMQFFFEGEVKGVVTREKRGEGGFGYDSIFQPEGQTKTFAEMSPEEKNRISHRAIAFNSMITFLKSTPV
jgi:XTP/dITP diphosphohydrolase